MNPAEIHLALNHVPLLLILVAVPLLIAALWRKSAELKGTASILFIVASLSAIPVFLTGDPAENLVVHKTGVSKADINEHEEAADYALFFAEALGALVLALVLFEKFKRPAPAFAWYFVVALGLFSLTVILRTAYLGGAIRHDEIKVEVVK